MAKICKVEAVRFDSSKQQSSGFVGAKSRQNRCAFHREVLHRIHFGEYEDEELRFGASAQ